MSKAMGKLAPMCIIQSRPRHANWLRQETKILTGVRDAEKRLRNKCVKMLERDKREYNRNKLQNSRPKPNL